MSNAHVTSAGCYRLPALYAAADLGIEPDSWIGHLDELIEADLVMFDGETEYILIRRWFRHNAPMNASHAKGTRRLIAEIESETLRKQCETEFSEAEKAMKERLVERASLKSDLADSPKRRETAEVISARSDGLMKTRYMQGAG